MDEKKPRGIEFNYHLLETRPCTGEGSEIDGPEEISVKSFLKAGRLIELDTFSFTHGPYTAICSKLYWPGGNIRQIFPEGWQIDRVRYILLHTRTLHCYM